MDELATSLRTYSNADVGRKFRRADSPQIAYLRGTQNREQQFPGFAPPSKAQSRSMELIMCMA
jgi:hypothetical protein